MRSPSLPDRVGVGLPPRVSATHRAPSRGERGAVAVEFALLLPLLVLLFGVVVGGARVWLARATVEQVAGAGARAASLARSPAEGVTQATAVARAQAVSDGLRCAPLTVVVDARGLTSPPGTAASVRVDVTCRVPLADVIVPGWPGELAVSATADSVVDRYRGR